MEIKDIVLSFAPAVNIERLKDYFDWLTECEDLWNMSDLYENFGRAFADLSSGEAQVVFGIWLASKRPLTDL